MIRALIEEITKEASKPTFEHSEWYIELHLKVVDKVARELCFYYGETYSERMIALVWMHDFGKIYHIGKDYPKYEGFLRELGFSDDFSNIVMQDVQQLDTKVKLEKSPFEVKIVSSADGVSHLITPFYMLYWRENHITSIHDVATENLRKLTVDWREKIVLDIAKQRYEEFYKSLRTQFESAI